MESFRSPFFMRLENWCVKWRTSSGNISWRSAQGRHEDGKDIQRRRDRIGTSAQSPSLEIAVCRAIQTRIGPKRAASSQPLELFSCNTRAVSSEFKRDLSDLVQEDRAAIATSIAQ